MATMWAGLLGGLVLAVPVSLLLGDELFNMALYFMGAGEIHDPVLSGLIGMLAASYTQVTVCLSLALGRWMRDWPKRRRRAGGAAA
jgi:hypothetical protein